MQIIKIFFPFVIFFKYIQTFPNCIEGENFCSKCNPVTKLCYKCQEDIYTPDEKGGCRYAEKINVQNAMKKEIYVKYVLKDIFLMKMEDALIQIIVKYLIKENALNVKTLIF